jgi:hypothetical protein
MHSIAATKLSDLVKPTAVGEPVNVHVVQPAHEPQPDFDAMKRLIESGLTPKDDGPSREREK